MFDLSAFDAGIASGSLTIALTYANGTKTNFTLNSPTDAWHTLSAFGTPTTHVTEVILSSSDFGLFQNFEFINVRAIPATPTVIDANIAVTSTPTGTGATYKIGDTVTVRTNAAASEVNGVTMDFSQFGEERRWSPQIRVTALGVPATRSPQAPSKPATAMFPSPSPMQAGQPRQPIRPTRGLTTWHQPPRSAPSCPPTPAFPDRTSSQTPHRRPSATLSTTLSGNDKVYGSLDDGVTWIDITSKVSGTTLTWDGVNLSAGSHAVRLKVVDAAGNQGAESARSTRWTPARLCALDTAAVQ
jgi:hypothetical protein